MSLRQHYEAPVTGTGNPPADFQAWLGQHHISQVWSYQPGSRFWTFQLIEAGWLVALSAMLIGSAIWLVRRGAA
jgi:hypothetical protein